MSRMGWAPTCRKLVLVVSLLLATVLWVQPAAAQRRATGQGADSAPLRHPADGATVLQNAPDLRWPWVQQAQGYTVEIEGPAGQVHRFESPRNSLSLPARLAVGSYRWRVLARPSGTQLPWWSFDVPADALPFVLPPDDELLARARAAARPRFRPPAMPVDAASNAQILRRVIADAQRPLDAVAELNPLDRVRDRAGYATDKRRAKRDGTRAADRLLSLALVVHQGGDAQAAALLRDLLLQVASWDPEGGSGVDGVHLVARDVVVALAVAYDVAHPALEPAQRDAVRVNIIRRAEAIRREFFSGDAMQRQPLNSHGWVTWGGAAAALALVAGEDPRADQLFVEMVPAFVTSISPWGGELGGFANGTAYGTYDVAALLVPFDVLGAVLGVDLYSKAWLHHFPRFLAYFNPPGGPAGPFGDAAEIVRNDHLAWTVRALAQRTQNPVASWHAGQMATDGTTRATLMLLGVGAGARAGAATLPPPSLVQSDIGWAALHSDLGDPKRTSVYFKSSPYGSHSHGHADQNAIVVHAAGQALLVGSGYYDFYGSEHFRSWYQTTRAHNAVTFDGGKGQPMQRLEAAGRIVAATLAADHDVVVGDATQAYAGQLDKALRSVVFVRPGLILVHDSLESKQPRRWEWNFHAIESMQGDAKQVRVERGGQTLCLDVLQAPDVAFERRKGFPVPPRSSGKNQAYTDQWHGAFIASAPTRAAEFVVALRVGCDGRVPRIERADEGWAVHANVGGRERSIHLHPGAAEVR